MGPKAGPENNVIWSRENSEASRRRTGREAGFENNAMTSRKNS